MAAFFALAGHTMGPRCGTLTPTIWWVCLASLWLPQLCRGQPPMVPRPVPPQEYHEPQEPEYHDFDYDGLPGVQFELKVNVPPRRQECLFQRVKQGAKVHVIFEGLKGADRKVELAVVRHDGQIIAGHPWATQGTVDTTVDMEGDYGFCIGNGQSTVSHKLVYIYIAAYLHQDWQKYTQEIEDFDISVQNFTNTLEAVDNVIRDARRHIASSRQHHVTDWYIISGNNSHIQNWSVLMCSVIVATSGLQVFFVRRLFRTPNVTPTSKPRA